MKTLTDTLLTYKGIEFDDFEIDERYNSVWSQICPECASKYKVDTLLSQCAGTPICGVRECHNEAEYYIDFPPKTKN